MVLGEPLQITVMLAEVFDKLEVKYFVGGSLASSIHGIPRATQNVDLVVELQKMHVKAFVTALEDDFYIDEGMILDAIRRKKSFNVIHFATMFKVDIFLLQSNERAQEELARRESYKLPESTQELFIASAEDMILEKLRWYKLGNQISDRQWQDVQGILKIKQPELDFDYLKSRANQMNLADLLLKAFKEIGRHENPSQTVLLIGSGQGTA